MVKPEKTEEPQFKGFSERSASEQIEFARYRALQYVERGDLRNALSSLRSDLNKHPKTSQHPAITDSVAEQIEGRLNQPLEVRRYIENLK